jgi:hypothetical protein
LPADDYRDRDDLAALLDKLDISAAHPLPMRVLSSEWLTANSQGCGHAYPEFPYRPAANLQFWFADVAHLPNEDWDALEGPGHPVYSPPLVAEVLSPSNTAKKIQRQRLAAFAGGTCEFWVVDLRERTIEVSLPGLRSHIYHEHESVPVAVISGALLPVRAIFRH